MSHHYKHKTCKEEEAKAIPQRHSFKFTIDAQTLIIAEDFINHSKSPDALLSTSTLRKPLVKAARQKTP